jgi:hypothetical protein
MKRRSARPGDYPRRSAAMLIGRHYFCPVFRCFSCCRVCSHIVFTTSPRRPRLPAIFARLSISTRVRSPNRTPLGASGSSVVGVRTSAAEPAWPRRSSSSTNRSQISSRSGGRRCLGGVGRGVRGVLSLIPASPSRRHLDKSTLRLRRQNPDLRSLTGAGSTQCGWAGLESVVVDEHLASFHSQCLDRINTAARRAGRSLASTAAASSRPRLLPAGW